MVTGAVSRRLSSGRSRLWLRSLIPDVHRLADAMVWAHGHIPTAAEELWVDEQTLKSRLDSAHPAEKAIITARLEEMQQWH